MALHDTRLDMA